MPQRQASANQSETYGVRFTSRPVAKPVRVLILEDSEADAELIRHELARSGLRTVIRRVDSESAFASAIADFAPDVVLSDHSVAHFDAQSALALLRRARPATPLIAVTVPFDGATAVACVRAGAADVIAKGNLSRLAASITEAIRLRRPLDKLTPRQIEVLQLVAEGYRTREIASRLRLSVKTVESHRGEVMKRLKIHDVVSLARYAIRVGLVPIAP